MSESGGRERRRESIIAREVSKCVTRRRGFFGSYVPKVEFPTRNKDHS